MNFPQSLSLKHHFLLAMPGLHDSVFTDSLTYIIEHSDDGAMGLIINHHLDMCLADLFEQLDVTDICIDDSAPVFVGGPVAVEHGFVLHSNDKRWSSTSDIGESLCLTTSRDILSDIAIEAGPARNLVALGYAGWGAGQLEQELADNAWLTIPGDQDILFDAPAAQRTQLAANKLGVDLAMLSAQAGHA